MPGGKVKLKEKPVVTLSQVQRNKNKSVTVIYGLDKFGVKLGDAAKAMGKKFACGSSVVKNAQNEDEINVQGDVLDDLVDFLKEKWNVSYLLYASYIARLMMTLLSSRRIRRRRNSLVTLSLYKCVNTWLPNQRYNVGIMSYDNA
jgi:translation initiation factor 1 (eIF-1/SUI1)